MSMSVYFGENDHQKEIDVFDLKLVHKEGHPAELVLTLSLKDLNQALINPCLTAKVEFKNKKDVFCLFKGRYTPHFTLIDEHFVSARFVAKKNPFSVDWPELEKTYFSQEPFFDSLFKAEKPEDHLKCRPLALYWDRVTGALSLSSVHKPAQHVFHTKDLELFFEQKNALKGVMLRIQAQWIQKIQGFKDIYPLIEENCAGKNLHTLSGNALKKSWPKAGSTLGQSGYYVLESMLDETPSPHANENLVRVFSQKNPLFIKKTWFKGRLVIGYTYRQKRQETLGLFLPMGSSVAQEGLLENETETLFFQLGALPSAQDVTPFLPRTFYAKDAKIQHEGAIYQAQEDMLTGKEFVEKGWEKKEEEFPFFQETFFLTPRGQKAFAYGLELAKTALMWKSRNFFVRIRFPLDMAQHLTLDQAITVHDERLPEKKLSGKVIAYDLCIKGQTGEDSLWITLACFLKDFGHSLDVMSSKTTQPFYGKTSFTYRLSHEISPFIEKLKDPVEKISIKNSAQEQEARIKNLSDDFELKDLKGYETQLHFRFVSLRGKVCQDTQLTLSSTQSFDPEKNLLT